MTQDDGERTNPCEKDIFGARCGLPGHFSYSDGMGFYHYFCDQHDPIELFQENRKLKQRILDLESATQTTMNLKKELESGD